MTTALLIVVVLLGVAGTALTIVSFRRHDGLHGLAGMTLMMIAAIPASVYASLSS